MILLCMTSIAFNVQADSAFIDKIKSVSIEGTTIIEIKDNDKKVMIAGTAKLDHLIWNILRKISRTATL